MTEEEGAIFPLFMRSAEELGDFVNGRGQVRSRVAWNAGFLEIMLYVTLFFDRFQVSSMH